jgi:hypothetical protein
MRCVTCFLGAPLALQPRRLPRCLALHSSLFPVTHSFAVHARALLCARVRRCGRFVGDRARSIDHRASLKRTLPRTARRLLPQCVAEGGIQIFVVTLSGKSITVPVAPGGTVARVKDEVFAREGIPPPEQRLLFGGKQLDDDGRALEAYGVGKESTLHLSLRLRGGSVRASRC